MVSAPFRRRRCIATHRGLLHRACQRAPHEIPRTYERNRAKFFAVWCEVYAPSAKRRSQVARIVPSRIHCDFSVARGSHGGHRPQTLRRTNAAHQSRGRSMTMGSNVQNMTQEQVRAKLAELEAREAAIAKREAAAATAGTGMKITDLGAVSVYGLGRFPITLYLSQWERLIGMVDNVKAFITTHRDKLSTGAEDPRFLAARAKRKAEAEAKANAKG